MKAKIFLIITGLIVLGLNGCGILAKKYTKSETSEYKINSSGKKKIKLDNINGNITLSPSLDSSQLSIKAYKEIKVKKKYLNTPFDEINIRIDTNSSIVSVETEINKKGGDGIFNFNKGQRVDYEIRIPINMELEIENVNGKVICENLNNDLKVSLTNGDIDLSKYTGKLKCEIKNGAFSGHIDSTKGIDINTINGNVTLFLNNYINANVRAESENGKITDENLQFKDVMREKKLFKGKLGNGDPNIDIRIETVNGRIKLYGRNEI